MATPKIKELQNCLVTISEMVQDIKEINAIMTLSQSIRIRASLVLLKKDIHEKITINRGGLSNTELAKYGLLDYANTLMSMLEGL
nr:MAG TPA: hypothetical protein [Caudoviricetes sp.]